MEGTPPILPGRSYRTRSPLRARAAPSESVTPRQGDPREDRSVLRRRHLRYCVRVRGEEAVPHASGRMEPTIPKGARPTEDGVDEVIRLASVLAGRPCAEGTGQDGQGQVTPAEGISAKRIGVGDGCVVVYVYPKLKRRPR
jgi:hypothetical protein